MTRSPLALAAAAAALLVSAPTALAADRDLSPLADARAAAELTDDDVGDAASFGRNVNWLGLLSAFVELDTDCSPATPTDPPRSNCVVINPAPAPTNFDRPDLAKITLPGKSTKSLICHWQTPIANVFWTNDTAANANARLTLRPYYVFENEVLADPTLVNPLTGLPFGGQFEQSLIAINDLETLAPGFSSSRLYTYTRTCIGGAISRNFLVDTLGLSDEQAKQFFRKPTTIRIGLRGSAQLAQFASINVGTRFLGD
jgi:hypothetical protein